MCLVSRCRNSIICLLFAGIAARLVCRVAMQAGHGGGNLRGDGGIRPGVSRPVPAKRARIGRVPRGKHLLTLPLPAPQPASVVGRTSRAPWMTGHANHGTRKTTWRGYVVIADSTRRGGLGVCVWVQSMAAAQAELRCHGGIGAVANGNGGGGDGASGGGSGGAPAQVLVLDDGVELKDYRHPPPTPMLAEADLGQTATAATAAEMPNALALDHPPGPLLR